MKLVDLNVKDFAQKMASSDPTPGGGSAAALSGLVGIALVEMVANLTIGRKKYAEHDELMQSIIKEAKVLREKFLNAIDDDAKSYDAVSRAFKLPKETDEEKAARSAAIQEATKGATLSPFVITELSLDAMKLAHSAIGKCNTNAASDLGVAAVNFRAAAKGAWLNILINLGGLKDEEFKADIRVKAKALRKEAKALAKEIKAFVIAEIDQ
ncbi:MAG: cyclodeaminase/cyclohydrolase family protein [Defluviitaleaceae bacterium]|nr:cyclodeaminase/cyclohydrolase family protein [Defluviitaleaceae bacterium]